MPTSTGTRYVSRTTPTSAPDPLKHPKRHIRFCLWLATGNAILVGSLTLFGQDATWAIYAMSVWALAAAAQQTGMWLGLRTSRLRLRRMAREFGIEGY